MVDQIKGKNKPKFDDVKSIFVQFGLESDDKRNFFLSLKSLKNKNKNTIIKTKLSHNTSILK